MIDYLNVLLTDDEIAFRSLFHALLAALVAKYTTGEAFVGMKFIETIHNYDWIVIYQMSDFRISQHACFDRCLHWKFYNNIHMDTGIWWFLLSVWVNFQLFNFNYRAVTQTQYSHIVLMDGFPGLIWILHWATQTK